MGVMLDRALRHFGFHPWTVPDGPEAVELFRNQGATIDLVLVDVQMPGMDGPQTMAALRQLGPHGSGDIHVR